jgi:hypothetical protein
MAENNELFSGKVKPLDFAEKSRIVGFECAKYVNRFFKDNVKDKPCLNEMKNRSNGAIQQNIS